MRFLPLPLCFIFVFSFFCFFVHPLEVHAAQQDRLDNVDVKEFFEERQQVYEKGLANPEEMYVNDASVNNRFWTVGTLGGANNLINLDCAYSLTSKLCTERQTAMGTVTKYMALIYGHPPASAVAWTQQMLANAGLAKPAYAQGIGFAALTPFFPLWQATRNIAYSLLIVVMIVIGFMLIFRTQIDAHTVISLQAALPKIVLSILMITFSYPIVGLLIDMMYLAIAIVISVFLQGMPGNVLSGYNMQQWQSSMMTGGFWTLWSTVWGAGLRSIDDFGKFWAIGAGSVGIGGLIGWLIGASTIGLGIAIGAAVPVGILLLLLGLGLLFVFIRLLMLLANAYIQVIISLILGPLILLNEAIPGHSAFKDWLFNIMANLSVFPATVMVLMFATFLTTSGAGGAWSPPFLPNAAGAGQGFFGAFLGITIIFLSPNLVVSVKKMFSPKPTLPVSAGTIFSPITGGAQTTMGMASQYYYFQQMFAHGPLASIGEKVGIGGGHKGEHH